MYSFKNFASFEDGFDNRQKTDEQPYQHNDYGAGINFNRIKPPRTTEGSTAKVSGVFIMFFNKVQKRCAFSHKHHYI